MELVDEDYIIIDSDFFGDYFNSEFIWCIVLMQNKNSFATSGLDCTLLEYVAVDYITTQIIGDDLFDAIYLETAQEIPELEAKIPELVEAYMNQINLEDIFGDELGNIIDELYSKVLDKIFPNEQEAGEVEA